MHNAPPTRPHPPHPSGLRDETIKRMMPINKDSTIILVVLCLSMPMPVLGPLLAIACGLRLMNWYSLVRDDPALRQLLDERPIADADVRKFKSAKVIFAIGAFGWLVLVGLIVFALLAIEAGR